MENQNMVAAQDAACRNFNSWIELCICFNLEYKVLSPEIYPILLINPMWSSHFDGFGADYKLSEEDEEGIRWIVIHRDDKFDPELYTHIVESWKFHHQVK